MSQMFFPYLMFKFAADDIELGLDTLLALGSVLWVKRNVEAEQVVQGSMASPSISFHYKFEERIMTLMLNIILKCSLMILNVNSEQRKPSDSETTLALIFSADPLSSRQSVERPCLAWPWCAAETLTTVGCVNPTGCSFLQSAGHAATATRLPQHLLAVCWDSRTVVQFLLCTGGTADRLQPNHWGRPHHRQDSQR